MKRVEFRTLQPGDRFEYEDPRKYVSPERRTKRDVVKPLSSGRWKVTDGTAHYVDGRVEPYSTRMTLYTEVGMTNHGYVTLEEQAVVLLLEEGE